MTRYIFLSLFAMGILVSCSTGYQSADDSVLAKTGIIKKNGYSDFQIDSNTFSVNFLGNSATSSRNVYNYTLVRAGEVTLNHGFRYFYVTNQRECSDIYALDYVVHNSPGITMHIRCYHEKPQGLEVYDAQKVANCIAKK